MSLREKIEAQYEADPNFNKAKWARDNGCSAQYVHKVLKNRSGSAANTNPKPPKELEWTDEVDHTKIDKDVNDKTGEINVNINSILVNTLEGAIDAANIDLVKYRIARHRISSSQVTLKIKRIAGYDKEGKAIIVSEPRTVANWHIQIFLVPNESRHAHEAIEALIKTIPRFKFSNFKPTNYGSRSGYAGIMALIDAHLGKFAWGKELNGRDYDLKSACEDYLYCTQENLSYMSPFKPEIIYYILGQDLMHTENYEGKTPKGGNILDVDNRLPKIIQKAKEVVLKSLYECRKVAPVEVLWVPGNHDMYSSLWMAHLVEEHFKDDKYLTVDLGPAVRKARLWGTTLVGWTHVLTGRHQSWANELAQSFPDLWAKSIYREWQHGHKHKKGEVKTFPIVTQGGVLMRQLTALSPIDFWHYDNLYTDAVPGGEAFVMHKKKGMVANFVSWTDHNYR